MINKPTFLSSFFSEHVLDKFSEFKHHVNSMNVNQQPRNTISIKKFDFLVLIVCLFV